MNHHHMVKKRIDWWVLLYCLPLFSLTRITELNLKAAMQIIFSSNVTPFPCHAPSFVSAMWQGPLVLTA